LTGYHRLQGQFYRGADISYEGENPSLTDALDGALERRSGAYGLKSIIRPPTLGKGSNLFGYGGSPKDRVIGAETAGYF
jgi:hypothetical protein